jgi:histidine triad (HIT) family protein
MRTEQDCLFCRIVRGDLPGDRVFETDTIVAFRDIQPAAPTHILIVPREHIASISELMPEDMLIAGELVMAARSVAVQEGLVERGFRLVANTGSWGGQTVDHLHFHLLGGRKLGALG